MENGKDFFTIFLINLNKGDYMLYKEFYNLELVEKNCVFIDFKETFNSGKRKEIDFLTNIGNVHLSLINRKTETTLSVEKIMKDIKLEGQSILNIYKIKENSNLVLYHSKYGYIEIFQNFYYIKRLEELL